MYTRLSDIPFSLTFLRISTLSKHSLSGGKDIPLMAGLEEEAVDKNLESAMPSASGGLPVSNVSSAFESMHLGTSEISFALDGRGSVSSVLDSKGEVIGSYSYNLTGQISAYSGTRCEYGWNAEPQDATTGLIYLRARFLMSTEGVFTSKDTYLGQVDNPASSNRYAYALGDPINIVDPSGHRGIASTIGMRVTREIQQIRARASYPPNFVGPIPIYTPPAISNHERYIQSLPEYGTARRDAAWILFKNGLISAEVAAKYCGNAVYMGKNAPAPSGTAYRYTQSRLDQALEATGYIIDAHEIAFSTGEFFSSRALANVPEAASNLKAIGKKLGWIGVGISVVDSIGGVIDYNNSHPELNTPDRIRNSIVEFGFQIIINTVGIIPSLEDLAREAIYETKWFGNQTLADVLYV